MNLKTAEFAAKVDGVVGLRTCPHCGGQVVIDDPEAHLRGVGYRVECEPCYLSMWAYAGEKPASLAARWNKRATSKVSRHGGNTEKNVNEQQTSNEATDIDNRAPSRVGLTDLLGGDLPGSMRETMTHIRRVQKLLGEVVQRLIERARLHDESKLCEPEASTFAVMTAKLKACTYGSDEYKQFLAEMKPALDHHYAHNSHHPEHWSGGIRAMSLLDLIEMLVDWKAAGERHADGSIGKSLDHNKGRFGYGEELDAILRRTAAELWPEWREEWHCFGCGCGGCVGNFCAMCGAGKNDYAAKA